MVNTKPIQTRSVHHIGDMYIHKKHKFIIKIVSRGQWGGSRKVEVVKGDVPKVVQERCKDYSGPWEDHEEGGFYPATMEYSTCALTVCFTKLKAGQVLFG